MRKHGAVVVSCSTSAEESAWLSLSLVVAIVVAPENGVLIHHHLNWQLVSEVLWPNRDCEVVVLVSLLFNIYNIFHFSCMFQLFVKQHQMTMS